jgi:hypothetical protein
MEFITMHYQNMIPVQNAVLCMEVSDQIRQVLQYKNFRKSGIAVMDNH